MIEPKKTFEINHNLKLSNKYFIESNRYKYPQPLYQEQLSKRSIYNLDDSNCFSNSINSNKIRNKDNNFFNHLIYRKKTTNSFCKINKNHKSEISTNNNNNNIAYKDSLKDNIDLTLNEYLKEEIKNMKYNYNDKEIKNPYNNINNNTEETKVNTLDINNYLLNEHPNTYRFYFNNSYKNKQNININNKFQKNKI